MASFAQRLVGLGNFAIGIGMLYRSWLVIGKGEEGLGRTFSNPCESEHLCRVLASVRITDAINEAGMFLRVDYKMCHIHTY